MSKRGSREHGADGGKGAAAISSPMPINLEQLDMDGILSGLVPMSLSSSYGSTASSLYRGSPRPTREEACELLEIMATPPQSMSPRDGLKRSQSLPSPGTRSPHAAPAMVSPKCIVSSASHEVSLYGPPYESSLPLPPSDTNKKYILKPRTSRPPRSPTKRSSCTSPKSCQHYGLGPSLSLLPESIIYSIISYIHYAERHPTLLLVSRGMTRLLTRPEFLFEMRHAHKPSTPDDRSLLSRALGQDDAIRNQSDANELLLVVGGKCPVKAGDVTNSTGDSRGEDVRFVNASELLDDGRRMPMTNNEQSGIMAYDSQKGGWVRFGGDPMKPTSSGTLHPLSPSGVVGSKPLYIGHPHYSLVFFGGTHHDTQAPSSRVVAYSFLTGRWERWTDMMRARHGEDVVVASVEGSVVLIGCDLELCDCFRCSSPPVDTQETYEDRLLGNLQREKRIGADMGRCEVLDLKTGQWQKRKSRAPSCPPDDGGVAVVGERFLYLPGTCPPPPATVSETSSDDNSRDGESMDAGSNHGEDEGIFRSLHYRPGLRYDFMLDRWETLPSRPFVTTSSPTTCAFEDRVVVLGGYRSSSENALSCYRHREEDSILDYEDHLDYSWCFDECSGEWMFAGGSTLFGHRQAWSHSSDMAQAVAAASAFKSDADANDAGCASTMPCGAPVPVRGATATVHQGRLTLLGGLGTFSRTFYDSERKSIWQFFPEHREWKRAKMSLPVPALLDGYAFSVHI